MLYFRSIVGPLLLAFIMTYLLHPVVMRLSNATRLSWRMSVNLIFLLLIILLMGGSTLAGFAIVQQIQNLIGIVQDFIANLPKLIADLSTTVYNIGPFQFDLGQYLNLSTISQEMINTAQSLLGRVGTLVSSFASGAAATIGWTLFVMLISYFILADAGKMPDTIDYVEIPGFDADVRQMGKSLASIWNAFLRGQLIIVGFVILIYVILLTILGVRYSLAIAIVAGLARFVPYVGPAVTWTTLALVAFFQGSTRFGIEPWLYTVIVVGAALLVDQIFDNLVSPRVIGQSLGVHPAAVLVAALVAANLIGIVGVVLAAPVLATLQLVLRYVIRKMLDLDPWPALEAPKQPSRYANPLGLNF